MKRALIFILALVLLIPTLSACGKRKKEAAVPTGVTITSEYRIGVGGEKYVVVYPDDGGEIKYKIDYTVLPESASGAEVEFKYDSEIDFASVAQDGTVVFDRARMASGAAAIQVTVRVKGTAEISDTITIYAKEK